MTPKEAFKLGFVAKLAEEKISPVDLVSACEALNKVAGLGVGDIASTGAGIAGAGIAASVPIPIGVGHSVGSVLEGAMISEGENADELRKKYLIKRLKDLIATQRVKSNNRLIAEAM
jgi:hypothetical protein